MPKVSGVVVFAERRLSKTGAAYWRVGLRGEDGQVRFWNVRDFQGQVGQNCTLFVSEAQLRSQKERGAPTPEDRAKDVGRDLLIARHVALKAAVDFAASRPGESWAPETVLDLAEIFHGWLIAELPKVGGSPAGVPDEDVPF